MAHRAEGLKSIPQWLKAMSELKLRPLFGNARCARAREIWEGEIAVYRSGKSIGERDERLLRLGRAALELFEDPAGQIARC